MIGLWEVCAACQAGYKRLEVEEASEEVSEKARLGRGRTVLECILTIFLCILRTTERGWVRQRIQVI